MEQWETSLKWQESWKQRVGFYIEVILILKIVYKYDSMFWPNLFDSTAKISPGEGYVLDSSPSQQNGMEMCCLVFWFKLYYRYALFSLHKTTLLLVTQIEVFWLKHTQIFKFNWIRGNVTRMLRFNGENSLGCMEAVLKWTP